MSFRTTKSTLHLFMDIVEQEDNNDKEEMDWSLSDDPSSEEKASDVPPKYVSSVQTVQTVESRVDKISTIIQDSESKLSTRTWVFVWKNYPHDYKSYLDLFMDKSVKYLVQPERNGNLHYMIGFFYFKNVVSYSTMEKVNQKVVTLNHQRNRIEWRKSDIHVHDLIKFLCASKMKNGPGSYKNTFDTRKKNEKQ